MSWSSALHGRDKNKLKGVRRRKWGKWVSEIRVPGTQERLWLGTYATAEAAAVAHDVAVYCLRRPSSLDKLNFPDTLSSYSLRLTDMSPRAVQKLASDVAMDVDARNFFALQPSPVVAQTYDNQIDNVFWWDANVNTDSASCQPTAADSTQAYPFTVSVEDYL
ncbi:hypothetical protein VNO78_07638 [Psophocarpus tetragonolobus]|uniref:AP2/ERF domain-containing protein n=1 Tax=Psophocarpus tetragonolobus TaxID=3891 RepID=A0AAN9T3K8_PSOTE